MEEACVVDLTSLSIHLVPTRFWGGNCMYAYSTVIIETLLNFDMSDRSRRVGALVIFCLLAIGFTNNLLMGLMISLALVSEHIL
jgi:hypothetical protein